MWHLGAARRFAQECVDLETLSDPASAEALVHYCAGAVILSCAAIEAYGNELLYAAETDKKKAKKPWLTSLSSCPTGERPWTRPRRNTPKLPP